MILILSMVHGYKHIIYTIMYKYMFINCVRCVPLLFCLSLLSQRASVKIGTFVCPVLVLLSRSRNHYRRRERERWRKCKMR